MSNLDRYTCEETFKRLNDYLDRALSAPEMELIRQHLAVCELCAKEFQFEESVLQGVRAKLRRIDLPPGLLDKISRALSRVEPDEAKG